jgi:cell division septal protein FtsQ
VLAVVAAGAAAASYVGLRESSLFAVERVDVQGGSAAVRETVRDRVASLAGHRSLLALDPAVLADGIVALPTVRAVHVDRAFPHTLRISIDPEQPVAVIERDGGRVAVARSGRVVGTVDGRGRLPVLDAGGAAVPGPGGSVPAALRPELDIATLARRRGLTSLVVVGRAEEGLVARIGRDDAIVRLGDGDELERKLAIAAALLKSRRIDAAGNRLPVQYVDVSVPDHPALRSAVADPATLRQGAVAVSDLPAGAPVDVAQLVTDLLRPAQTLN